MVIRKMGFYEAWFSIINKFVIRVLEIAGVIALVGILLSLVIYLATL
jgi:hypothetical protein